MSGCLNVLVLRIIYLSKIFLNVIRFVIPILLIIKMTLDVYKRVINGNDLKQEIVKKSSTRIIAAIIIFLVPTIINVLFGLIDKVSDTSYSGIRQCLEFASPEYIEELTRERDEKEKELYLTESEKSLSAYEKMVAETRRVVESTKQMATVGTPASSSNLIKCGRGSSYNTALFNNVRTAGYKTREGVVAAAIYVSSHIDVHIPYFWSGGHFHNYSGYVDKGENLIGVPDKWGCNVKMAFGGTDKQKDGVAYPFGTDCSGFLAWAIFNGGYYTGNSNQTITVSTGSTPPSSIGGISVSSVKTGNAKGKIKAGDIAFKSGHVGMVVEVNDSGFTVAEEQGYSTGLVISKHTYSKSRFTDIVLMDNFYQNYQKGTALWSNFK